MASPNLDDITTTTMLNRSRMVADNVSHNNALLGKLKLRSRIKTFSGGRTINQELSFAETSTYKRYSGYELLDISPSEVLTAATYPIRQAAVAVTISGLEEIQNAGREQMIDLLDARIENAERTMANNLSNDIYSDGTASAGKQINGLQALVATSPTTGTVGNINRANYTFWRNQTNTTFASGTAGSANTAFNELWVATCRGSDKPDLIACADSVYTNYLASLQDRQRFSSERGMAGAGFTTLMYQSAEVVLDGGVGGDAPDNTFYMLNTDYLMWRPHSRRNMVPLNKDRYSVNQDAMVKLLVFAGNLTMSNAQLQGVGN